MVAKPDNRALAQVLDRAIPVGTIDIAAVAYAMAFYLWLIVTPRGTAATGLIATFAFYPIGLAVAWASWRNSRLAGLDQPTRVGWQMFALASLVLLVGGIAGDLVSWITGIQVEPLWIGNLRVLHGALLIAAYLAFPVRQFEGQSRVRFLLDVGLVVLAGLAISMYFALKLWLKLPQDESGPGALGAQLIDCAVFVLAAVGSVRKRDRGSRLAHAYWALAITTFIAANYALAAGLIGPARTYHRGDPIDALWFGAWVFRWLAARAARASYEADLAAGQPDQARTREYESSRFSYLVVGGAFLLLIGRISVHDHQFLGALALFTATMFVLLVVRQIVELDENDRLYAQELAQQARYQSLVQRSSDITLVVDSSGAITYASPAAARDLGGDSPVRAGSRLLDVVREDDRAAVGSLLSTGRGPRRLVFHLEAPRGEWREIEALWSDLRHNPEVDGFVMNCRDITIRAELKRQLRHAQRLEAVGRLADGLAHDVNNALTVIRGVSDLIDNEIPKGSPASEDLSHIRQAVARAGNLTRRVLDFSRRQPARREVIDLNIVVEGLLPVLNQVATQSVEVWPTLADGLWPVRADPGQLEQVLVNLATNARDAMPEGGTLRLVTENRRIEAAAGPDAPPAGDYVSVTVADNGAGIAPDVIGRIFEPFFSTKPHGAGMGLGLAMVRDIVRESEGYVLVESEPGRGSSFTVLLPRSLEQVSDAEEQSRAAVAPGRSYTILMVDDETFVRKVTRRILERHGYRVIEAEGGPQALEVVEDPSAAFDLLLTDLVMPGVHGRQLIARCAELRPSLPVVCMTGFAGEREDLDQSAANVAEVLLKPFTADGLVRAVAAAVAAKGAA